MRRRGGNAAVMMALMMAAACGGGGDSAGGADGGADGAQQPDGGPPDAQTHGTVTVNVHANGGPASVVIYYHDVDGTYLGTVTSNASGEAVIDDMPIGGSVTARVSPWGETSPNGYLTTITGVQIGDVLNFGKATPFNADPPPVAGSVQADLPALGVANAVEYDVHAGCGTATTASVGAVVAVVLSEGCVATDDTIDVVAFGVDSGGNRIASSTAIDVELSGNLLFGTVDMPNFAAPLATYAVAANNAPVLTTGRFELRGYRSGLLVDRTRNKTATVPATGGFNYDFGVAPDWYDEMTVILHGEVEVGVMKTDFSAVAIRDASRPTTSASVSKSFNLADDLLPGISQVTATTTAPVTVTWSDVTLSCRDNPTPDLLMMKVTGSDSGGTPNEYDWWVLLPGDVDSGVELPDLGADGDALFPLANFDTIRAALIFKSDSTMTYSDFRVSEDNFAGDDYEPATAGTRCILQSGDF